MLTTLLLHTLAVQFTSALDKLLVMATANNRSSHFVLHTERESLRSRKHTFLCHYAITFFTYSLAYGLDVLSALEIFLSMRYINLHFTYLLTYLLDLRHRWLAGLTVKTLDLRP